MEGLGKLVSLPTLYRVFVILFSQHVAVLFKPRCVMNLGHYGLHVFLCGTVTIVEAHGIEAVTEIAKVREQTYASGRPCSEGALHKVSHGSI
jgi:hypothetical protein